MKIWMAGLAALVMAGGAMAEVKPDAARRNAIAAAPLPDDKAALTAHVLFLASTRCAGGMGRSERTELPSP